ncbi:hypothetical protein EUTSA_v10009691mg, partial [Eutrema salsugineum]
MAEITNEESGMHLHLVFSFPLTSLIRCTKKGSSLKNTHMLCFVFFVYLCFYLFLFVLLLGSKLSELYGTYTCKIENFSQIRNRELRSNVFEVGGYEWSILVYPEGCDVFNHLSLFLCVANRDKLPTGWSHFALFTMSVMNKDPKKSKLSDTLHEFCKKEHDWGWKKFMELFRLHDGFIHDSDSLIIKVQVQVIRERLDRPFPCLDGQYRRELVKVYKRNKRSKLIDDKTRWTSLCAFWLGMDQSSRRKMSREKKDVILKLVVKQFFIKNEVTSPLVMDFLFHVLTSLDRKTDKERVIHSISKQVGKLFMDDLDSSHNGSKTLEDEPKKEREELPAPIVSVERDLFVLVDDAMLLLEKAVLEPLHYERGPQNRMEVGNEGERDEKVLTEFARQTLEVFVLNHIFCNKIEVAYKEDIALKLQEELIREEEGLKKRRT